MKHTNLFIALGAAFCLISCNSNTKTHSNSSAENATETTTETVATANDVNAPDESSLIKLDFKIDGEIPAELDGVTIERQTYMGPEGEDAVKYVVKKADELIVELKPNYDYSSDSYNNTIDEIIIFSDKYRDESKLHVGSKVSDVLAAYPDDLYIVYKIDEVIELGVISTNIQYYVDKDGYDGQLPEVYGIEGTELENPTFKSDAVVSKIRIYLIA